jgi:hypothetical protein
MSWETLTTGFILIKDATEEDINLIKSYLELGGNETETIKIEKERDITTIDFTSVNWNSHISEEKIDELLKKLKNKITECSISLYYLNEADYTWFNGGGEYD